MDDTDKPKRRFPPPHKETQKIFVTVRERDDHGIHGRTKINEIQRLHELLLEGADVDALDAHGETALVWAGRYGRTEILRLLIERGADLSPENPSAARALYGASMCGHPETARALLDAGVSVNAWCPAEHVNSAILQPDDSVTFRYANHPGRHAEPWTKALSTVFCRAGCTEQNDQSRPDQGMRPRHAAPVRGTWRAMEAPRHDVGVGLC